MMIKMWVQLIEELDDECDFKPYMHIIERMAQVLKTYLSNCIYLLLPIGSTV